MQCKKLVNQNVSNCKIPTKYLSQTKWKLRVDFQLHICSCEKVAFVLAIRQVTTNMR
jgi:hypothetical protein